MMCIGTLTEKKLPPAKPTTDKKMITVADQKEPQQELQLHCDIFRQCGG